MSTSGPIRAALAETLEQSDHTSVQRRIEALRCSLALISEDGGEQADELADAFLASLEIDELQDELGPRPSATAKRCSDKGFLAMPLAAYLELLDWTARQFAPGKSGATPHNSPLILQRLKIEPEVWCGLVSGFGELFSLIAGRPEHIDSYRGSKRGCRFHVPRTTRQLLDC